LPENKCLVPPEMP